MTTAPKQRISKKEQRRQDLARQRRKRNLLIGVPVTLILLFLVGMFIYRVFEPELEGVAAFGVLSQNHDREATYAESGLPPVGGSHSPTWQNCGIYDAPVDAAMAAHSMEHGAVWLAYNPDLPADDVETLRKTVRGKGYTLMSPYPNLESDVVMSSWSRQLKLDSIDEARIKDFIGRYRQKGPEPGALCSGGFGVPIE
jgi:hypothetical protein